MPSSRLRDGFCIYQYTGYITLDLRSQSGDYDSSWDGKLCMIDDWISQCVENIQKRCIVLNKKSFIWKAALSAISNRWLIKPLHLETSSPGWYKSSYIYINGRTDVCLFVCLLVCGGLIEIQTSAPIMMKFCTHIPTCPRKVLVQVWPLPPPHWAWGA